MSMGLQDELMPELVQEASAAAESSNVAGSNVGLQTPPSKGADWETHPGGTMASPVKTSLRAKRVLRSEPATFGVAKLPRQVLKPAKRLREDGPQQVTDGKVPKSQMVQEEAMERPVDESSSEESRWSESKVFFFHFVVFALDKSFCFVCCLFNNSDNSDSKGA